MREEEKKTQNKRKIAIIMGLILVGVGSIIFFMGPFQDHTFGLEKIPFEKLSQYDLVCYAQNHVRLCVLNNTSNNAFFINSTITVPATNTTKQHTFDGYLIEGLKGHCLTEYHAEEKSFSYLGCDMKMAFPKPEWKAFQIATPNGITRLVALTNGSVNQN